MIINLIEMLGQKSSAIGCTVDGVRVYTILEISMCGVGIYI